MKKFYYDKSHPLWVGQEALEQLTTHLEQLGKTPKAAKAAARRFLAKQAIFQVHIPPPEKVEHPHYMVDEPNKLGMVDLVTMPPDKLYGNVYKHMLVYVDVATSFAVVRPLRSKSAKDTAFAMTDILKLVHPQQIYADAGNEFKGAFKKLLDDRDIKFKSEVTKYHHGFTGPVDNVIMNITKKLFKRMDAQELRNPKEASTLWVRFLQQEVAYHNDKVMHKIGMSPSKAMKLEKVTLKKPPQGEVAS